MQLTDPGLRAVLATDFYVICMKNCFKLDHEVTCVGIS